MKKQKDLLTSKFEQFLDIRLIKSCVDIAGILRYN